MKEKEWDKKLGINTIGRDNSHADEYHHPYEPTPYVVLERLVQSGYIDKENVLLDYGCGKGRVSFFVSNKIGCRVIGLEHDEKIYSQAIHNLMGYQKKEDVKFLRISAESYQVKVADCFYFFNPFRVEILKAVINRIMASYYESPRRLRLFFYYPDEEYIKYLLVEESARISFVDEINCSDLFAGNNPRERIMVFEIAG